MDQHHAHLNEGALTSICAGDQWLGRELVSCRGYGFPRVGSRGGEGATVQLEQRYYR